MVITETDEKTVPLKKIKAQEVFPLTNAFAPFIFKQSLGVSFIPLERDYLNLFIKLGGGFVEVWTQNGIVVSDDTKTENILELKRLQDYVQGGIELRLKMTGVLLNKILNYSLESSAMLPFFTNVKTNLSIIELLNFDLNFKLGIRLFKWLSINYSLSLIRAPLIQPQLQVVNNIILGINWNIL